MLVLVVVVVMAEVFCGALRGSQDRGLVGFWVVGSSPTVVGSVEHSSWGSPFPSTDSELHKCESVKPHEAARYPTRLGPPACLSSVVRGSNKGQPAPFLFGCVCLSVEQSCK